MTHPHVHHVSASGGNLAPVHLEAPYPRRCAEILPAAASANSVCVSTHCTLYLPSTRSIAPTPPQQSRTNVASPLQLEVRRTRFVPVFTDLSTKYSSKVSKPAKCKYDPHVVSTSEMARAPSCATWHTATVASFCSLPPANHISGVFSYRYTSDIGDNGQPARRCRHATGCGGW